MMKFWGKQLRGYQPDQGFSLPLAMGFGLVMLLLGTTLVLRSQSDQVLAKGKNADQSALNNAEVGLVRYQALMNRYRHLVLYPSCSHTGSTPCVGDSWQQVTTSSALRTAFCQGATSAIAEIQAQGNTNWQDIVVGDPSQGQYRLVSYRFAASSPGEGLGTLTVEGRANPSGTSGNDISISTARLEVQLPVRQQSLRTDIFPGVWLKSGTSQNRPLRSNVFVNDCAADLSQISTTNASGVPYTDPATSRPYGVYLTDVPMPSLPVKPKTSNALKSFTGDLTLPRSSDTYEQLPDGTRVYRYQASRIRLTRTQQLTIQTGSYDTATATYTPVQVELYVDGEIGGSTLATPGASIRHICALPPAGPLPKVPPSASSITGENCLPVNLKIYAYGQPTMALAQPVRPKLCLAVADTLKAMVFAPEYQVGTDGAGGLTGNLWGHSWLADCGSGSPQVAVTQGANWSNLPATMAIPTIPRFEPASQWQRQEVPK